MQCEFVSSIQALFLVVSNFAFSGLRNQALCSVTPFHDATVMSVDPYRNSNVVSVVKMREDGSVCLVIGFDKSAGSSRPPIDPTYPLWALGVFAVLLCQRICILTLSDVPLDLRDFLFLRPKNDVDGQWDNRQSGVIVGLRSEDLWKEFRLFCSQNGVKIPPHVTQYRSLRQVTEG